MNILKLWTALLIAGGLGAQGGLATTIAVSPSTTTVGAGGAFALDVSITDAIDLFAWQFDVGFDPAVLSANTVTEGPFLLTGGNTSFFDGFIDNVGGTVTFVSGSLIGAVPGVDGAGVLATINFSALTVGTSFVELSGVILLDSQLGDIPTDLQSGSVEVTAIPEPTTFLTVGTAMLFMGLARRRFRSR